ncbi:LOW QUALITY PROTEIN: protein diaphanous homolog 1 [Spheniscus humboldti]
MTLSKEKQQPLKEKDVVMREMVCCYLHPVLWVFLTLAAASALGSPGGDAPGSAVAAIQRLQPVLGVDLLSWDPIIFFSMRFLESARIHNANMVLCAIKVGLCSYGTWSRREIVRCLKAFVNNQREALRRRWQESACMRVYAIVWDLQPKSWGWPPSKGFANGKPHYYVLADECDSQIIVYKNGADPDFRRKHLDMNPERWMDNSIDKTKVEKIEAVVELETKLDSELTAEELQVEMKKTKRDLEEKLLDAHGGKEMLDMEKQQMTAEKQKLASKVSHLSEDVLLGLRYGLMSLGWRG